MGFSAHVTDSPFQGDYQDVEIKTAYNSDNLPLYLKELKKYLPGFLQNRSLMCDRLKVFVLLHCEYDSTQPRLGKKKAVLAAQPFILTSIYQLPRKMNVLTEQLSHANDEQLEQAGIAKLSKIKHLKLQLAVLD